jgi:hypothetical protein
MAEVPITSKLAQSELLVFTTSHTVATTPSLYQVCYIVVLATYDIIHKETP